MAEYHVGCGIAGIYAGILKPNGYEWKVKTEVTKEALNAAAHFLFMNDAECRFAVDNKRYVMKIEEMKESK